MTPPVVLCDTDFARLRLLLARAAGLVFDDARRESLAYSVTERLRATGLTTVGEYLDLVQQPGNAERQQLLDEVTIQETHFFRNPPQVRALRAHVVPELVREAAAGSRRLRIWSAGCSTGEEPYTIAMLLRELLPSTAGWDVRVVATDLSTKALEAARSGVYGPRAVQLASDEERARFFVALPDGRFQVRPEVAELVDFRHHNLVTEPPPFGADDRLDLVLCRNVTIYFSRETTRALMGRLHSALRHGGYLFLGHSETLWQVSDAFRLVALGAGDSAAYVYRRLDAGTGERRRVLPDRRTFDEGPGDPDRRTGPRRAWEALTRGRVRDPDAAPAVPPARVAEMPSAATLLSSGRAALAAGRYDDAASLAESAAAATPLHAPAHRLRGEALVALGRDEQALIALRKALYLDPDDALAHFQLAGALSRTGNPAAAGREYRAAAEVVARRPHGASSPELEGRDGEEFVRLCRRLAEQAGAPLNGRLSAAGELS
jgi:chemotaxis protein methyltransferase CheR